MAHEFRTTRYPQLQVHSPAGKARFVDGAFSTDDEDLAVALRALPDSYGVTAVDAPDEGDQEPVKPPVRSASKADWKAYAVTQGMDEDEADKATRDELAAKYADGSGD
ncbi:hypothetical protein [Streptomyces sp. NPDC058335]|uniref:hypothetical protein n=1 Tax=Streptomyces sp. NPDC058335 TaxID=3346451 RepID=UPI00365AFCC2